LLAHTKPAHAAVLGPGRTFVPRTKLVVHRSNIDFLKQVTMQSVYTQITWKWGKTCDRKSRLWACCI